MSYEIRWTHGRVDGGYETDIDARNAVYARYPDAEIGHDGDLSQGGDRTLCWASEEDAKDDAGAMAIAEIVRAA